MKNLILLAFTSLILFTACEESLTECKECQKRIEKYSIDETGSETFLSNEVTETYGEICGTSLTDLESQDPVTTTEPWIEGFDQKTIEFIECN